MGGSPHFSTLASSGEDSTEETREPPITFGLNVYRRGRMQRHLLSSSIYEGDIKRAYELGVNAFLVKPSESKVTIDMCQALKHFWLQHNQPPSSLVP